MYVSSQCFVHFHILLLITSWFFFSARMPLVLLFEWWCLIISSLFWPPFCHCMFLFSVFFYMCADNEATVWSWKPPTFTQFTSSRLIMVSVRLVQSKPKPLWNLCPMVTAKSFLIQRDKWIRLGGRHPFKANEQNFNLGCAFHFCIEFFNHILPCYLR